MKRCVITGAANGIGEALAVLAAQQGLEVIGVDKDAERAQEVSEALKAQVLEISFIHADVSRDDGLETITKTLAEGPPIDILVHCAGINAVGSFETLDMARQQQVLEVDLLAPMQLTSALLRQERIAPGGSLVFIASLSHFVSYPGAAAYAAAKSGLASYARSLSVGLAPKGVHVLTVFPGPTRTGHAREHSPDNSNETLRMPPERLAEEIFRAIDNRQKELIPGLNNKVFAAMGQYLPTITERVMRGRIFERLEKN